MAIERGFKPMAIHKNVVIRCLTDHPEDLKNVSPEWTGTVEEFIEALRSDTREWIVRGELRESP